MQRIVLVVSLLTALAACASRRGFPSHDSAKLEATTVGCDVEQFAIEWKENRHKSVNPGDDLCLALGRWGKPMSEGVSQQGDVLYKTLHFNWNGIIYTVNAVYLAPLDKYKDEGYITGRWIVNTTSFIR